MESALKKDVDQADTQKPIFHAIKSLMHYVDY